MDKYEINTPRWTVAKRIEDINYEDIDNMGYPVVVKPNNGGSSIANFLVKEKEDILKINEPVVFFRKARSERKDKYGCKY